jgi:precorrin-3B synthase
VPSSRSRPDACPGVRTPTRAADGDLVRIRLPGGAVGSHALNALAGCAERAAGGRVELTSRGNLQLRGLVPGDPAPARALETAGLLPSATHERVRNVVASPLSGIRGGVADVRGLAGALDELLCATPELAELPGRFLFAIDDGRGDVAAQRPDVCWRASGPDAGALLVAGTATRLGADRDRVPALLVEAAQAFLAVRRDVGNRAWRAVEIARAADRIAARMTAGDPAHDRASTRGGPPVGPGGAAAHRAPLDELVGTITRDDGGRAAGAAAPLGELSAAQLRVLGGFGQEIVVTPWRTVVVPAADSETLDVLAAAGLVVSPRDPAVRISACAGRPGCDKSLADVRSDVRGALAAAAVPVERIHVVGCVRGCGTPHEAHLPVVATAEGYRAGAGPVKDDLAAALAASR